MQRILTLLMTTCIACCGNQAYATPKIPDESFENLKAVTTNFLLKTVSLNADETVNVKVYQPQFSKHLPVCTQAIDAALPQESNREQINAVELTCNGEKSWHTTIPVAVQVLTKVLVAKRVIPRNDTINEEDLEYAQYDRTHLYSGSFKNKNDLIGQVAAQTISAGNVFTKKNTQASIIVHRNQVVDLVATNNSVTVSMKGIAKADGRMNDAIKAYNPSSKRMLDAIVIGSNRVEVIS